MYCSSYGADFIETFSLVVNESEMQNSCKILGEVRNEL